MRTTANSASNGRRSDLTRKAVGMERYNVHDEYMTPSEAGNVVLHADAQRALDAEREKVAKLEKIQAIDLKNNNEYREQLATLQAQLRQAEGELANEKTAYKKLSEQWNKDSLDLIKLMPMLTAHNVAAVLDRLAREGVTE